MERTITQEESKSQGQLLLLHEARIHRFKDTDPVLEGGSSHGVDKASGFYDVKCLKTSPLTPVKSEAAG